MFSSGFPTKMYVFHIPHACTSLLDLITASNNVLLKVQIINCSLCKFIQRAIITTLIFPKRQTEIMLGNSCNRTLAVCMKIRNQRRMCLNMWLLSPEDVNKSDARLRRSAVFYLPVIRFGNICLSLETVTFLTLPKTLKIWIHKTKSFVSCFIGAW
jgi:hypothetical protein